MSVRCVRCCVLRMVVLSSYALLVQLFAAYSYIYIVSLHVTVHVYR